MSDTGNKTHRSRSGRAGLTFPVGRVARMMRAHLVKPRRLSDKAPVYMAAVLQYLVAELLVAANEHATARKARRINQSDINLGVRGNERLHVHGDDDLARLFSGRVVSRGGEPPFIHTALQRRATKTA
jgi:histone H2A